MAKSKSDWIRDYVTLGPDRPTIFLAEDERGRGLWLLQQPSTPRRLVGWMALDGVLDSARKQGAAIVVRTDLPPLS